MFLSVSSYISRIQDFEQQVNLRRVKTPDGIVSESDIVEAHMAEYRHLYEKKEITSDYFWYSQSKVTSQIDQIRSL